MDFVLLGVSPVAQAPDTGLSRVRSHIRAHMGLGIQSFSFLAEHEPCNLVDPIAVQRIRKRSVLLFLQPLPWASLLDNRICCLAAQIHNLISASSH